MNMPFDLTQDLHAFSGRAPLFPLSSVVLFPHIMLPLHIVEPRDCRMVADALDGDRLIATVLPKACWGVARNVEFPPVFDTACLGRITGETRRADGRFFLVLQGLSRARVVAEEHQDRPYRVGRLELCSDHYPSQPVIDRSHRRRELLAGFRDLFCHVNLDHIRHTLHQAVEADVPLGVLCDVLTYAMRLEPSASQKILVELDADFRSDFVLEQIRELARREMKRGLTLDFPPTFSLN